MQFAWSNSAFDKAEFILLGCCDESGSHAKRQGTAMGPTAIRQVSNEREIFERGGVRNIVQTENARFTRKLHDMGDVRKPQVFQEIQNIIKKKRIPVVIGGDHSITAEVIRGMNGVMKEKVALVYFDAHPDIVSSSKQYYGSVVCDVSKYNCIDAKRIVEVGIRAPETEELSNLRKKRIVTITSLDVIRDGVKKTAERIKKAVGKRKVYLSIDIDVTDPAFCPGVDTPEPGGLSTNELLYLAKEVAKLGLAGFDVMEVSPPNDRDDLTSHFASKLIAEVVQSAK